MPIPGGGWVMPQFSRRGGPSGILNSVSANAAGTVITASPTTAHVKPTNYTDLLLSPAEDTYGIAVMIAGNAANNISACLVDIGIGGATGAAADAVLIPNLMGGRATSGITLVSHYYVFPLRIPAGKRISARAQSSTINQTMQIDVSLLTRNVGDMGWWGSRVTAYGVDTATSDGVLVTAGNNAYGSAAEIVASSTNPIRYMQFGIQVSSSTIGSILGMEMLVGSTVIWDRFRANTLAAGTCNYNIGNALLSLAPGFNIPSGKQLQMAAAINSGVFNNLRTAIYGMD